MDTQATFFATLVDEWARCGITDAVIAPGSRSSLMAATLEQEPRIRTHVMIDERSASFFALGIGLATGRPAIIWTTSGTATSEVHAAVIEADQSHVPLLVCTADRPTELQYARDWQSTPQVQMYGSSTRWTYSPGAAVEDTRPYWRSMAARSVNEAMHNLSGPGPVHLNLAIREPWTNEVGDIPAPRTSRNQSEVATPWHVMHRAVVSPPANVVDQLSRLDRRGVVIAGAGEYDVDVVHSLAEALGWPVLADVRSGCRIDRPNTISFMDALLRSEPFMDAFVPEVVLRFGKPPMSKVVPIWVTKSQAEEWLVDPLNNWAGSISEAANIVQCEPTELCRQVLERITGVASTQTETQDPTLNATAVASASKWLDAWKQADAIAAKSITNTIDLALVQTSSIDGFGDLGFSDQGASGAADSDASVSASGRPISGSSAASSPTSSPLTSKAVASARLNEPAIARTVVATMPAGSNLFASTSMPVRDVEWYSEKRSKLTVFANRGASGMDGVTSTAAGVSFASGKRTALLIGDLTFLYDLNALWVLKGAESPIDLTLVVQDNNGGGVFEMLPQLGVFEPAVFERVIATPQDADIVAICGAFGVKVEIVSSLDELSSALHRSMDAGGLRVVYVRTNRTVNGDLRKRIHADVREAISPFLESL